MRPRSVLFAAALSFGVLATARAPADGTVPVSVSAVGHGEIRLIVAEGTARPCESADNHVLFNGHASVGDEVKLTSAIGSVCVDHTYGAFRESQWAGGTIWSSGDFGPHP